MKTRWTRIILALMVGILMAPAAWGQTVRAVMHAELKHLDPHWTTANITQQHGLMMYDTLFSLDSKGNPQPNMVDKYTVSKDLLTYTFTLRDGLLFHDGQPVRAVDAVTSIKRWAVKDAAGQKIMAKMESFEAKDAKTFVLKLKEPYPLVLRGLAKENSYVPFILPERHALQDPSKAFEGDPVGSGPFKFVKEEWVPGSKTVYVKFKEYKPRAEKADYFSGGKVVNVDRVEWISIPDASTAVAALQKGEVDFLERPVSDQLPLLRADSNIMLARVDISQMQIHPNHLLPPFNNVKARQALLTMSDQEYYLRAMAGEPENWRKCYTFLGCESWLATDVGSDLLKNPNLELATKLLKESGYKGEPVVVMVPSDFAVINAASLATVAMLRKIGVNVDMQTMDWGTLTSRRPIKEDPSANKGGWNIFLTYSGYSSLKDPWGFANLSTSCEKAWFGWACDMDTSKALDELGALKEGTPEFKKKQEQYHRGLMANIPYVPMGEFFQLSAWRKDRLSGVIPTPFQAFWNLTKKE
ncbi:MAG: ABC transporter substrate-binding protein [Deltaproteobacteria bacterium]|nr:ABC transporter substrate-binding protein [Deltaproteobacteria bacterium]